MSACFPIRRRVPAAMIAGALTCFAPACDWLHSVSQTFGAGSGAPAAPPVAAPVERETDISGLPHYEVAQGNPLASDANPGTPDRPWKTIAKAAQSVKAGDRVLIRAGVYRENAQVTASGTAGQPIWFAKKIGESVVMTGADILTGWQRPDPARPIYAVPWAGGGDPAAGLVWRTEQVIIDGKLLRQVATAADLAPGTFLADLVAHQLLVWDTQGRALTGAGAPVVEAATRGNLLSVNGAYVTVQGLDFRYAANYAQNGAVVLAGTADVLRFATIEWTNSNGANFVTSAGITVDHCVFSNNGQEGFSAVNATGFYFYQNWVTGNNVKGYDRGWEAGGDKVVLTRGAVIEQNRFTANHGAGLWFDIGNESAEIRNNLFADNEGGGIFYEISYTAHIHDNVITHNSTLPVGGDWGSESGITLSSSPGAVVERNIIYGNPDGFDFREQFRGTPRISELTTGAPEHPIWNHHEVIRNNLIVRNAGMQVGGWSDVPDAQNWYFPDTCDRTAAGGCADAPLRTCDVGAETAGCQRGPLALTEISFVDNVFFQPGGGAYLLWGVPWRRAEWLATPADTRSALGIDQGGRIADPAFRAPATLDFRLSAAEMAQFSDAYPQGSVPGVQLGSD